MRLIIDSHLDISWNALSFNRDQRETVAAINEREGHMTDSTARARATLSLPELRDSGAGVVLATILSRAKREIQPAAGHPRICVDHGTQDIAYAVGQGQLAYYYTMEDQGYMKQLFTVGDLESHWQTWEEADDYSDLPIGYILAMEGADPIVEPSQAEQWWNDGLRSVMLSHYGKSHYSVGTGDTGPLTDKGRALLKEFDRLGMILDLTHMCDESFFEAMSLFQGPVMASHNNCRALVPGDRQFSDDQLKVLLERGAVIGAALDAWMLKPGFVQHKSANDDVKLAHVIDHMDHIRELSGNTDQIALGTDLDGGFGHEQTPGDFKLYRDLHNLTPLLAERGYSDEDIDKIFYGNWLRYFREHLPQS
jgi:membrane dipeptidase